MSRDVISFDENESAFDICEYLTKKPIMRVPIVRDNKLVGIVSRRDIIKTILNVRRRLGARE